MSTKFLKVLIEMAAPTMALCLKVVAQVWADPLVIYVGVGKGDFLDISVIYVFIDFDVKEHRCEAREGFSI